MLKSYKYRLYPNQKQIEHLIQSMGCVRYIYNQALALRTSHYQQTGKNLSYFDLCKNFLIEEKNKNEWLKNANAQSLQMSLRNLDNAFMRFFHKISAYPKFKNKHSNYQSIRYPQAIQVFFGISKIKIPKLGKVNIVFDRKFEGKIKTCTVTKTPTNKFFISILVDDGKDLPIKSIIEEKSTVGIDLGIKDFAILSDGTKFLNPSNLRKSLNKLKVQQRKLSKKQKGSNKRNKQRLKVARIHEKIINQRKDYLHKLSTSIVNSENQTIVMEDLAIGNMLKNHKLTLSISDCGWGMFKEFLKYKCEWKGKNLIFIGRFEPSSKMCSNCGHLKKDLKLSDREWICINCNQKHDRDINAAINIKKFGLHSQSKSGQELSKEPIEIFGREEILENKIDEMGSSNYLE